MSAANETCPSCRGSGEETVIVGGKPSRRRAGEVEVETRGRTCPRCGGSGEVPSAPRTHVPASIHGAKMLAIAPDVWLEDVSPPQGFCILHSTRQGLLDRVARALAPDAPQRATGLGPNGAWTLPVLGRERQRAILLAWARALPLVSGQRAKHHGYAPAAANDTRAAR